MIRSSGLVDGGRTMFVVHCRGDGIHMDDDPLPLMDGVLVAPRDQQAVSYCGSTMGTTRRPKS